MDAPCAIHSASDEVTVARFRKIPSMRGFSGIDAWAASPCGGISPGHGGPSKAGIEELEQHEGLRVLRGRFAEAKQEPREAYQHHPSYPRAHTQRIGLV